MFKIDFSVSVLLWIKLTHNIWSCLLALIGLLDYQKNWFGRSEIFLTLFMNAIYSSKFYLDIDLDISAERENWEWNFFPDLALKLFI